MRTEIKRVSMDEALRLPLGTEVCIEPVGKAGEFYLPGKYERCITLEQAKAFKVEELGGFNCRCRVIIFTDEPPKPLESMLPMERLAFQLKHLPEKRGMDFKAMEKHLATDWMSAPDDWADVTAKQAGVLLFGLGVVRALIAPEQRQQFDAAAESARQAIIAAATPPPLNKKLSFAIKTAVDNAEQF